MTLDKPLTADDQVRVVFSLIGDEGTNDKSPIKAATYSAKAEKYDKAESAGIVARKGGADVKSWLDRSMLSGDVKVTSASADEIAGDINLSSGDIAIKGSFTAKVLKRK
jgi:formylmethanofuran dehydrogenase subunit C